MFYFFFFTGGHVLVQCIQKSASGETSMILDLDYITDIVTQNFTLAGIPFVTPDSNNVVIVDKEAGKVSVFKVNERGQHTLSNLLLLKMIFGSITRKDLMNYCH